MIENIMSTFSENIDSLIHSGDSDLKKAESGIQLSVKTLTKLQKHVDKEDFEDPQSEIDFFRNIKPLPMSYHIYFSQYVIVRLNYQKSVILIRCDFSRKR